MPSLVGRVTRDGVPVAGASILIRGDGFGNSAQTDATGRFLAQMFGTGEIQVTVRSHQLGVAAYHELTTVDGFNPMDVSLTAAASVAGVVVDQAGRPVPSVHVRILDHTRSSVSQVLSLQFAMDTTDAAGRFRIRGLPGGTRPLGFDVFPEDSIGDDDRLFFPIVGVPVTVRIPDDATAIEGLRIVVDLSEVSQRR
jgi:hypothetical protein